MLFAYFITIIKKVVYKCYNYYPKYTIGLCPTSLQCQDMSQGRFVFNSTGKATGGVSHPIITGGSLGRGMSTRQTHSSTSPRLAGFQIDN